MMAELMSSGTFRMGFRLKLCVSRNMTPVLAHGAGGHAACCSFVSLLHHDAEILASAVALVTV